MHSTSSRHCRPGLVTIGVTCVTLATIAASTSAAVSAPSAAVRVTWMPGFAAPGTPANLNKVGVIEVGPRNARNVLVLEPGTLAGGGYFVPLATWVVANARGWQVWSVENRENLLEDQSVLNLAKEGQAPPQQLFDYYLGFLADPSITQHFQFIPDSSVAFARQWGLRVTVEDLHRVIEVAKRHGHRVVLGGHSRGGAVVTAYATWDFNGRAGADDLAGLVYIDGGTGPTPVTVQDAQQALQSLESSSPWVAFGGIAAPLAGLFIATGSTGALIDPNGPSLGQAFPLLPANLKPPIPVTNLAQFGYALDTKTSPSSLIAAQAHLGQLAASGDPRGWDSTGALTPIQRYAEMFSGTGLQNVDGSQWYYPTRLTIDLGAVADGNANPAQSVLDVPATHGSDLPRQLRIYAFGAALGGQAVLDAATILATQSHIPSRNLTLVNRQSTYAHNDPAGAYPNNDFFDNLVPFLDKISGHMVVPSGAGAALGQCTLCLMAAGAQHQECTSSAIGAFQDVRDGCLDRDHECVDACRSSRQDCRDSTGLGAELLACASQLETDTASCQDTFPLTARKSSQKRATCIYRAQLATFRCSRAAHRSLRRALGGCDRAFHHCAGACGPGEPPGGTAACKAQGKGAFQAVLADCKVTFQVTASACLEKDATCVQDCANARVTCGAPTQSTLAAALAACAAQTSAAVAACGAANPGGGAPLQQCITVAQANAAVCRDAALQAAAPGVSACVPPYVMCVHACPPPSS